MAKSQSFAGLFRAGGSGLFAVDTATRTEEAVERAQSHLAAVGRDAALLEGDFDGDQFVRLRTLRHRLDRVTAEPQRQTV